MPTPTSGDSYSIRDRQARRPLFALIEVTENHVKIFPVSQTDLDEQLIRDALRCLTEEGL